MQSAHSLFLRRRFMLRSRATLAHVTVPRRRTASRRPPPGIVCLRLAGQLCADNADALVDVVSARVQEALPSPCSVVLDLSATPALDEDAGQALQVLHHRLADSRVCLRLVLPEAKARAAFLCGAGTAIGPDCVHASVRAAALAAYASLPGAALVTSAQRDLLTQPPEQLAALAAQDRPE